MAKYLLHIMKVPIHVAVVKLQKVECTMSRKAEFTFQMFALVKRKKTKLIILLDSQTALKSV